MTTKKLIGYNIEGFKKFYEEIFEEGILVSFMILFDAEGRFVSTSYGTEKCFFDISNLIIFLSNNLNALNYYEMVILNVIKENEECEFVIEESQLETALTLFRNIFFIDEDLEEEPIDSLNKEASYEVLRKDITIYDDVSFGTFKDNIIDESIEYCLISQLARITNTVSYTVKTNSIDPSKNYMIDISNLLSNPIYESLFRIESLLSELTKYDNIDFCVRIEYEEIIKKKLRPLFDNIKYLTDVSNQSENDYKPLNLYNKDEISSMFNEIKTKYFGHSKFIKELEGKINSFILLSNLGRTKVFSALLCGSSGVGKTEIGRLLHKYLSPNSVQIKLNFGNYTNRGSLWSLIGSPKGYEGSNDGGELTNKIKSSNSKVILIDEFDRADPDIFNFFYELLEDGSYTDLSGNVIDLTGYVMIFTSNLNQANYSKVIPESLLSRIDMTVEFKELKRNQIKKFIEYTIDELLDDYIDYSRRSNIILEDEKLIYIRNELLKIEDTAETNMRRLKRMILNKFSELIR